MHKNECINSHFNREFSQKLKKNWSLSPLISLIPWKSENKTSAALARLWGKCDKMGGQGKKMSAELNFGIEAKTVSKNLHKEKF